MKKSKKVYGWHPDLPDARDYFRNPASGSLPDSVDLRNLCPPVYDQGQLGSCTANAIAAALEFDQMKQGEKFFTPSRLFIYYNERSMEGTVGQDAGAQIRDGVKSVNTIGVCDEKMWRYDEIEFKTKPAAVCYQVAEKSKSVIYKRVVRSINDLMGCLASGIPFVFGFTVYESFEGQEIAKTGIMTMPSAGEKVLGGHAVICVGYDNSKQSFIVRNSWGDGWGDKGYFYMPYIFMLHKGYASDFWTIKTVE